MDLTTPEGTRAFLLICLDGRKKRTGAKLATFEMPWFLDAIRQHAPEVIAHRDAAEDARRSADRAQRAYATALETWIRTPNGTTETEA
ncbi:hypothetical protein [Kitasatospora cineracea]|uniref:Uncharacterized protein n=1 Tax=Kitasatospora cineracea TaxID=88074 RepID=A0A3N4RNM4_9ACTN|nr:hypothetical protein [Kitasatospora cineracea]RPE34953.1 hypothetical protein EDD38_3296 [Kitasatospora cineracea]